MNATGNDILAVFSVVRTFAETPAKTPGACNAFEVKRLPETLKFELALLVELTFIAMDRLDVFITAMFMDTVAAVLSILKVFET